MSVRDDGDPHGEGQGGEPSANTSPLVPGADGVTVDELRATLSEKTKLLIQRERDVQTLLRQVQETNRWTEQSAAIAMRIASQLSAAAAMEVLVCALAEDLSFEFAAAWWLGAYSEVPSFPTSASRQRAQGLVEALSKRGETALYAAWEDVEPGGIVDGVAGAVPAPQGDEEPVLFFIGRSARTARYASTRPEVFARAVARLARVIAQAFGAVRLNIALARERDSLQDAVERATHDLRHALHVAETSRAEAQTAAKARSEFLANMSHEIRTPMTAVLGYAQLLDDPALSEETRAQYLGVLQSSGHHLLQLIDDVLDLARIESGRLRVDPQAASIRDVLVSVMTMLEARARGKGLSLELQVLSTLPAAARFDVARMRQILINLVGNAIKFTHNGSVSIQARYTSSRLEVVVSDTGIGVPADKLELIFDAFEQSSAGMARQYGGSGLGLAISRRLARLMGGDIRVESTLNVGSRFVVWIDAQEAALVHPAERHAPTSASAPAETTSRKVLLVDDTAVNRRLMQHMLTTAGHRVVTACDGVEALEVMERGPGLDAPFEIILLDMQMPNMDGYEAARRLRDRGCQLPIVALTANAMVGDRERCLEAGCTDYLSKPVDRALLLRTITTVCGAVSTPGGL